MKFIIFKGSRFLHHAGVAVIVLGVLLLTGCGPEQVDIPTSIPAIKPDFTTAPDPAPEPTRVPLPEPPFYFGVDLSYVNEMDDCGAVYLENAEQRDAFQLFSEHGANLVRARLWHNPDWTDYSTLTDVQRTFSRARDAGMFTLLAFHFSDNWADPGKQAIPAAWEDLDEDELAQALYDYTYEVLSTLDEQGLMPAFVQIGNEINSGILKRDRSFDWQRNAKMINAGIQAVRDAAEATGTNPKIVLHIAQPENAGWWFREGRESGITDFDVIGLSFYPQWSLFSIADIGTHVSYLRQEFGKEVIVVETAYPWTLDAAVETADNILNQGVRGYPFTPEGQRQYMIDLTQSLISNGGLGVVYWEPAWISTQCTTRWGQGSHWENATFFDFKNNNEVNAGIEFLSYAYQFPARLVDGIIDEAYGEALAQDAIGDNLDQVPHLDLLNLYVYDNVGSIYLGLTIAGDVYGPHWGGYFVYFDITQDEQGADIDVDRRPITIADPYQPEFRLDISLVDRKGTVGGVYEFYAWDGEEWQILTLSGGAAIGYGSPAVIEVQMPKSLLGNPEFVNIGVISVGRGRVHTAGDILGIDYSPSDWNEAVLLDNFIHYSLVQE